MVLIGDIKWRKQIIKFKNSDRFSPIVFHEDLPWQEDYFHLRPEEITKEFRLNGLYDIDVEWWNKQNERCLNGFSVEDTIDYGGDVYRDEKEAFWNDSMTVNRFVKEIDYVIPPNSCYIPMYDLLIKNKTVRISGRHYFYLNFGKIYALDNSKEKKIVSAEYEDMKGLNSPMFTDVDWGFFVRIANMFKFKKDTSEMKTRQLGYSRKSGIGLMGFNFTFLRNSQTIVAGGMSDDANNTFSICRDFLENISNTQFYKSKKRGGDRDDFVKASRFGSEVRSISCKDNTQALSRFCLAKGTKVIMYDGSLKKVEDILIGDKLMGPDSKPRNVKRLSNGIDEMYQISSRISKPFICNSGHPLYLKHIPLSRKRGISRSGHWVQNNFIDKDTIQLDDNHFLITAENYNKKSKTFKRYSYTERSKLIEFNKRETFLDPYFLGIWLGDGDSDSPRFTTMDNEIVEYLQQIANKFGMKITKKHFTNTNKACRYAITDGQKGKGKQSYIIKGLRNYGLIKNKHIPEDFLINDKESRFSLLAGLLDTDGWKNKRGYGFAQVNEKLTDQVIWLCQSLGLTVNKYYKKDNGTINGYVSNSIYELYIYGENCHLIPCKIKRKIQTKFIYTTDRTTKSETLIEKIGLGEYYGFELDNDHLFLLEDFTITHNTPFLTVFEEGGKWKKGLIKKVIEFNKAAQKAQAKKTGFNVIIATGGDMDLGAADMEIMHYNPDNYGLLSYENIWEKDDSCIVKRSGHFTSGWLFKVIDDNGNSIKEASLKFLDDELKLKKEVVERYIFKTQFAVYAADAFMIASGGFFGEEIVLRCNARKAHIVTHGLDQKKKVGRLEWKDPKHPLKGVTFFNDENGSITIFEDPEIDQNGNVYENLYKAGTDSYDQDESKTSVSKGDIRIYKTFLNANKTYNKFVAKCTDRPTEAQGGKNIWYENTAKLCVYYSVLGADLIEWSKILIVEWFINNGFETLLKERPGLSIATWIKKPQATNRYGIDTSTKLYWLTKYRKWLEIPENIDNMDDVEQLTAVAKFKLDPNYNCDTTIASSLAIVCAEDDIEMEVRSSSNEVKEKGVIVYRMIDGELKQVFI